MTFDAKWKQLIGKSPKLLDGNATVEITSSQLQRLLRQFFDAGVDYQKAQQRVEDFIQKAVDPLDFLKR
mgnify:FL=1